MSHVTRVKESCNRTVILPRHRDNESVTKLTRVNEYTLTAILKLHDENE